MKSIFKHTATIGAVLLLLGITSCKQVEIDTAQYADDAVTLASFGPNPVMRGAQLRFFGSNLDKIAKVNVPGVEPITSIEVIKSGKLSEIRITLPVEGPEVGYVTLLSKDGDQFTTKSMLNYTEPIVFEGFEVAAPAFPGDVITLKGDYMNLVKKVIFQGGATVEVEEGATRHEAKVIIPASAKNGTIVLSDDGAVENLFYSELPLEMGEPTVKKAADAVIKAGKAVTISGAHLEMIEKIVAGGIEVTDFELSEDNASITFILPDQSASGSILAISYEGNEYNAGDFESTVPVIDSINPLPVKAGGILTITGKDLDLITGIDFEGAEDAIFAYENGKILVLVPETATEGKISLKLANGTSVESEITLVHPVIEAVSPLEVYAGDPTPITVSGKDLDLVVSAAMGGKALSIENKGETSLDLYTDATSVSGKVELTLANGELIVSEEEITVKYHALVVLTSRPSAQHIGQEVVLLGSNLNLVESIFIGDTKVTQYSIRKDDEIRFLMPWCKTGSYELKFQLYNGDVEIQAEPIGVLLEQTIKTIWEGEFAVGGWAAGFQPLSWGGYDWSSVKKGTTLMVYYSIDPAASYAPQLRFGNGSWASMPSVKNQFTSADGEGNIPLAEGSNYIALTLGAEDLDQLVNNGGLVLCGAWFIVEKVQLINDIPQERILFEGDAEVNWNNAVTIPASEVATWEVGMELAIHYTVTPADYHMIRIINNDWSFNPDGNNAYNWNDLVGNSVIKKTVDAELLQNLGGKDMSFTGFGCNINLVTIL